MRCVHIRVCAYLCVCVCVYYRVFQYVLIALFSGVSAPVSHWCFWNSKEGLSQVAPVSSRSPGAPDNSAQNFFLVGKCGPLEGYRVRETRSNLVPARKDVELQRCWTPSQPMNVWENLTILKHWEWCQFSPPVLVPENLSILSVTAFKEKLNVFIGKL